MRCVAVISAVVFGLAGLFLLQNPMLAFGGVFVYLGAGAEVEQVRRRTFARQQPTTVVTERVSDFMTHQFRVVSPSQQLAAAADNLLPTSQYGFPVVDGGRFVGMLRRRDLVASLRSRLSCTCNS